MTTTKSLEEQLHELQNQLKTIQNKYQTVEQQKEAFKRKYEDLKNEKINNNSKQNHHDNEFWGKIRHQLSVGDTDSIKLMIKNKTLGLSDIDQYERTILILARYSCS